MESVDWVVLGGQMGLGAILGFAVGYTAKKALKVALVLTGLSVLAGVGLQQLGFITIHWPEIEAAYTRTLEETGGFIALLEQWTSSLAALVPVGGSFALGFLYGLRKG